MQKKKETNLSWEDFQNLGDPNKAPKEIEEDNSNDTQISKSEKIRIYLDRKNRRGKSVTLLKGLEDYNDDILKPIAKTLKSLCGVGGNTKYGEIMLQGDHRDKVLDYFQKQGFTDVKKAGG